MTETPRGTGAPVSTKIGSQQKQSPEDNTGARTNTSASRYNHITPILTLSSPSIRCLACADAQWCDDPAYLGYSNNDISTV